MRCAAALASAFEEVAQVRYSRSGSLALSRRPNQDLDPTGKLRQRLGDVIDRLEGVQRAGAGVADFINAGRDRRLDIFATPGTGIALPFTPGRNHCAPSQQAEMRQFWSIDPANEQRLCWNLNALLQKIGDGNRGEITISWMVKPVTAIAAIVHRGLRRGVAVLCRTHDLRHRCPAPLPITRSRHRRRPSAAACGIGAAGRKIAPLHKKQSGR